MYLTNNSSSCHTRNEFAWRRISLFLVASMLPLNCSFAYQPAGVLARRAWLRNMLVIAPSTVAFPLASHAAEDPNLQMIKEGRDTLTTLLDNWERATVDCTFADVPRELLESKNKDELLEKASTFALFDKSTAVETCKTSNRIVRDYLGVTGKGPLVGMEKRMRKSLDLLADPDRLDDYVSEVEKFSQSMSRAASLSYTAGTADFDSVNNFEKDSKDRNENSNLEQSRRAIAEAKTSMDLILDMLGSSTT